MRKTMHYTLLLCILLIQGIIAFFLYREFATRKKLSFIENQHKEVSFLEKLTDRAGSEFRSSEDFFQNYLRDGNRRHLDSLTNSVSRLAENLKQVERYRNENSSLKELVRFEKTGLPDFTRLRPLVDSAQEISSSVSAHSVGKIPQLRKYQPKLDFGKYDVEKQTYTDTLKKKGLFGRLKDAISGKEMVRKDSTVITLKQGDAPTSIQMKREVDSLMDVAGTFYNTEIRNVQRTINQNQKIDTKVYQAFGNLLILGNNLIGVYDLAIKKAKNNIEKELFAETSLQNRTRINLAFSAMGLMFLASLMVVYFTRMSFGYEKKLREANRQILENLNFKSRILGMLSHELRSPLKIIGIFIRRIEKKTNDETVKDYLKSIQYTNDSLLIQANQILEYTKNQHQPKKLIPVPFNLKEEVDSILKSLKPYVESRNNSFITEDHLASDIMVFSDKAKLNQLFMNIVGNANKFTENGKISVAVSTVSSGQDQIDFTAVISDTGVGISESDIAGIFQPYYQGIISDEVENLGAGLGLSLCKEIVELFPGTISVTSELHKGTTVYFTVSLKLYP